MIKFKLIPYRTHATWQFDTPQNLIFPTSPNYWLCEFCKNAKFLYDSFKIIMLPQGSLTSQSFFPSISCTLYICNFSLQYLLKIWVRVWCSYGPQRGANNENIIYIHVHQCEFFTSKIFSAGWISNKIWGSIPNSVIFPRLSMMCSMCLQVFVAICSKNFLGFWTPRVMPPCGTQPPYSMAFKQLIVPTLY